MIYYSQRTAVSFRNIKSSSTITKTFGSHTQKGYTGAFFVGNAAQKSEKVVEKCCNICNNICILILPFQVVGLREID
jgi:hypothetical protein